VVEAGETLGLTKDAAQKAYERAIAHLRDLITEHSTVPVLK